MQSRRPVALGPDQRPQPGRARCWAAVQSTIMDLRRVLRPEPVKCAIGGFLLRWCGVDGRQVIRGYGDRPAGAGPAACRHEPVATGSVDACTVLNQILHGEGAGQPAVCDRWPQVQSELAWRHALAMLASSLQTLTCGYRINRSLRSSLRTLARGYELATGTTRVAQ